ncbi:MAG: alpha/beta hydrolase [Pseudomonadales bacterium]|nr:alpha/beta hydrolase [Pseudomonadales bacterium]NRA14680.1 alpha/beta hydrolase [Oceanospirillaceae bacterium]
MLQHYRQKYASKGTVIIIHGYMDHSALYRQLIMDRLNSGWDVLIYDKLGHGLSAGARYDIAGFTQYALQLDAVLRYLAGCAEQTDHWQLIGQSTGAAVIMEHVFNSQMTEFEQLKQRILLAPLVRCQQFNRVKLHYQLMRWLRSKVKRSFSSNSHDADFLQLIRHRDPFTCNFMKVRWVGAMLQWEKEYLLQSKSELALLIVQGDDDGTVAWRYNVEAIKKQFPNSELVVIAGARHQLVNEAALWRDQVFKAIEQYS